MGTQGVFGYIIGKKRRLTHVQTDADLLWQIGVREIYVLMKHYGSKDLLQKEFETIKPIKPDSKPKPSDIEKCKIFTNLEAETNELKWNSLLYYCQHSYINLLESGYIIHQKDEYGYIFILDFNKEIATFKTNEKILQLATLEEIMDFDEMPTRALSEIITDMQTRFKSWFQKFAAINEELKRLQNLKQNANQQGAVNIEVKVDKLIDEMLFERKQLIMNRREVYQRLKELNLIEEEE